MPVYKTILSLWFRLSQPVRFVLIGGYNTIFAYLLFALIYFVLENYFLSLTISFILSVLNNFVVFKIFVFQTQKNWKKELAKTYVSYIGIYFLNLLLLWIFIDIFSWSAYMAQLISSIIIPFVTYFLLKSFSFKSK